MAAETNPSRLRYQFKQLSEAVENAKQHADNPQYWEQAQLHLNHLAEDSSILPEAERTQLLKKVKEWEPLIQAGVLQAQAGRLARRIKDTFERIDEALQGREIPDRELERMEEYVEDEVFRKGFSEPDRKAHLKHLASAQEAVKKIKDDFKAKELDQTLQRAEESLQELKEAVKENPKADHSHLGTVVEGRLGTAKSLLDELSPNHPARPAALKRWTAAKKTLDAL